MLPSSKAGIPVPNTKIPARDNASTSLVVCPPVGRIGNDREIDSMRRFDEGRSSEWSDIV